MEQRRAQSKRSRTKPGQILPEESALHDSRGNGAAESAGCAVKEIKDQARTLLASTSSKYGLELKGDHILMP
eukprot:6482905-Amphidinium_carterae.3